MTVLILERVPVKLRGELSRWMIEPRTGVFVGRISALVRDRLWDHVTVEGSKARARHPTRKAGAVLIYRARTEQGFAVRTFGDPSRELLEMEGLTLVRVPKAFSKSKGEATEASEAPGLSAREEGG